MKICIFGAGAIGGHLGALLSNQGIQVTLIARGEHLKKMQSDGLTLVTETGGVLVTRPRCTNDPRTLGVQDYVIITLKAHATTKVVEMITPLLGPNTVVVPAVNGIPWWYFYKLQGPYEDNRINCLDPDNNQWNAIDPSRVLGCVVWASAEVIQPGVVRHIHGNRMPLGEPDGSRSERAKTLSQILISCGLKSPVRNNIRNEIWMKLWGNLTFNPLSALTSATLETLANDPECLPIIRSMMQEGKKVGQALGVKFSMDIEARIRATASVGNHRTSMLQDLEQGRLMEIDALIGSVVELARLVNIPTPTIDLIYALSTLRAREAGCYPS